MNLNKLLNKDTISNAWNTLAENDVAWAITAPFVASITKPFTDQQRSIGWTGVTINVANTDTNAMLQLDMKAYMESAYPGGTRQFMLPTQQTFDNAAFIAWSASYALNVLAWQLTFLQRGQNFPPPSGDIKSYRWGMKKSTFMGVSIKAEPFYASEDSANITTMAANDNGGSLCYIPFFWDYSSSVKPKKFQYDPNDQFFGLTVEMAAATRKIALADNFAPLNELNFNGKTAIRFQVADKDVDMRAIHPKYSISRHYVVSEADVNDACTALVSLISVDFPEFEWTTDGESVIGEAQTYGDFINFTFANPNMGKFNGSLLINPNSANVGNNYNDIIMFGPRYFKVSVNMQVNITVDPITPIDDRAPVILEELSNVLNVSMCTVLPAVNNTTAVKQSFLLK